MANKNAKNTMNAPDVHVVAPSNMGKGLVYSEAEKKYEVDARNANGVKLNPDGSVGVALSPDAGNQLELRNNGLYYGNIVKANNSAVYVSSVSGNDNNDGSKASPFKTIHRAINEIAANKSNGLYRIFLKAGEYFEFPRTRVWLSQQQLTLEFHYYDDPKYPYAPEWFGIYRPYGAVDLQRPTLEFTSYFDSNLNTIVYSGFNTGGIFNLHLYGIHVRYDTLQPGGVAGLGFYHEELIYEGCVIDLNAKSVGIGSASEVRLRGNIFNGAKPNVYNLFISDKTPKIWTFAPLVEQADGRGRAPNFTLQMGNEKQVLKYNNLCLLSQYDVNTKTLFGFSTNWDCFA